MKQIFRLGQNKSCRILLFAAVFSLASAATAFSQVTPAGGFTPPDDTPSVKVGGTFYGNYTYTQAPKSTDADGNTISPNSFDVTRSYLNFTGNINHAISFRITPDITRATATTAGSPGSLTNNLVFRIKYAYVQFGLDDYTKNWKQTWVRLGANQTPYVDWDEGVYRYRFQGTMFSERVGRLTSSDYGASFHTNFPNNYGDVHLGVYNGEGYSTFEGTTSNRKAFQVRATFRPLPRGAITPRGLRLTAFYDADSYMKNDQKRRFIFKALFEHPRIAASGEWMDARDQTTAVAALVKGRGYSFWATPALIERGKGPELLLRYDSYEPNTAVSPISKQNTTIFGIAYWFHHQGNVNTVLLLDREEVSFPGAVTPTPSQRRIALHAQFVF